MSVRPFTFANLIKPSKDKEDSGQNCTLKYMIDSKFEKSRSSFLKAIRKYLMAENVYAEKHTANRHEADASMNNSANETASSVRAEEQEAWRFADVVYEAALTRVS